VTGEVRIDGPVLEVEKAAQEWLRAMWPEFRQMLRQVDEKLKSDPKNSELIAQQREITKRIDWLMKDAGRRALRDAIRRPPGKPKKD
jgi:phosphoglycerate-specific signal transduction histidine kinase